MSITVKKVYEFDIRDDCWGGAKDRIESLTDELVDELSGILDDPGLWENGEDPDGIPEETTVNDFIWHDDDTYAEWLGFEDADQLWEYCDLVNGGTDEDEIWEDEDSGKLVTFADVEAAYSDWVAGLDQEDLDDYGYEDAEEWADGEGTFSKFERG